MNYVWDNVHRAYYRQLLYHHVYLYSITTLAVYLPEGYASRLWILREVIASSSDEKHKEVPLLTDEPMTAVDGPPTPLQRHQGISYANIKTPLQTIISSIASLFTHMDQHFT